MIKLSMDHVNAICHAEFFTDAAISKLDGSRMRHSIESDLQRLAELKLYIIEKMVKPELPFNEKAKDNGSAGTDSAD